MSTKKKLLHAPIVKLGPGWTYDKKTRGAFNESTGERISRRQLDKKFGSLQGFTSYEQKAKQRKNLGATGFHSMGTHQGWMSMTYTSRPAMLAALKNIDQSKEVLVYIYGVPVEEKYRVEQNARKVWVVADPSETVGQRVKASLMLKDYERNPLGAEKKLKKVEKWTIAVKTK